VIRCTAGTVDVNSDAQLGEVHVALLDAFLYSSDVWASASMFGVVVRLEYP
jgi:hypothetical protein